MKGINSFGLGSSFDDQVNAHFECIPFEKIGVITQVQQVQLLKRIIKIQSDYDFGYHNYLTKSDTLWTLAQH